MNEFEKALLEAVPAAEQEDGDYVQDGLIFCGKCRTPREMRLNAPGTGLDGKVVQISCSCREAAYRAEKAAKTAKENAEKLAAHVQRMVEAGIADPFPAATFALDDNPERKLTLAAKRYVENFPKAYENNLGLMFYGPPGTGKTFLAGCIANALNDAGSHVLYTSIRKLTTAANRNYGEDADLVQREVQRCSLLVLDDFGVERDTEYSWEQTERIINWRYEARRPLLATTNLDPQEMQGGDIIRQRVFDRILEMCQRVKVDGESRRRKNAAEKAKLMRELFGG